MIDHINHTAILLGTRLLDTVEFFLTVTVSIAFIWHLGIADVAGATLGLLIGGVAAAPIGAWAAKRIPPKPMLIMVGVVLTATSEAALDFVDMADLKAHAIDLS